MSCFSWSNWAVDGP